MSTPPGAAPKSTACSPGRSSRNCSSSVRKVANASASFSVDRDGTSRGIFRRGMPIAHAEFQSGALVVT